MVSWKVCVLLACFKEPLFLPCGTVESIQDLSAKQNRIVRYSIYTVSSFQRIKIFNLYIKVLSQD